MHSSTVAIVAATLLLLDEAILPAGLTQRTDTSHKSVSGLAVIRKINGSSPYICLNDCTTLITMKRISCK